MLAFLHDGPSRFRIKKIIQLEEMLDTHHELSSFPNVTINTVHQDLDSDKQ